MKTKIALLGGVLFSLLAVNPSFAATRYVNIDNASPAPPYTDWASAATNIQDAVDAAVAGEDILVTNGVYQSGARAVYGMSNRVAVTNALTVRSVNGPLVTTIVGSGPIGSNAVRCVFLGDGATLAGFTLTNGATQTSSSYNSPNASGGGVWCGSASTWITNCTLTGNSAFSKGGGAHFGTLNNCTIAGNSAQDGGGVFYGTLNNCSLTANSAQYGGGTEGGTLNNCNITGNSAQYGGGVFYGTLNNSIVYYNTPLSAGNYYSATFNYCCTMPLPFDGVGNTAADPQLASASHLGEASPCRGRGNPTYASGLDIDGETWRNPPSIGCDEYLSGSVTGELTAAILIASTNLAPGFAVGFQGIITGRVNASRWDFGDGVVVSNQPWTSHAWSAVGDYVAELRAYNESYPGGIAASITVRVIQAGHYVALASSNPVAPYNSWATAATNIQDAVDAAVAGEDILVTNGVYQTGARAIYGISNRVAVTKAVTVRSVNGPALTSIIGSGPIGSNAVRCVYLTNGAVLSGFTLTNGATRASGGVSANESGGGVWCESASALVTNCVLTGNSAHYHGGGAYSGTLNNCTLTCNSASGDGGGAYSGTLNNCVLTGNSANVGGGTADAGLSNCTLTGNSAYSAGGGDWGGTLNNCIIYYNTAPSGSNYSLSGLNYCCTTPLPSGSIGNTSVEPELASASHLSATSPCRAAGSASYVSGVDIDGEPWTDPPSIGCDEYWSGSVTGALNVAILALSTNVVARFELDFQALIDGRTSGSRWDFGDGGVVTNQPWVSHAWRVAGDYLVRLRAFNEDYPNGIAASVAVHVQPPPIHYVALTSTNPVQPYLSWATAATNIQDAVDAAGIGQEILVTNGVYQTGTRAVYGMSNRVAVTKELTIRSINGPEVTTIVGHRDPATTNGPAAVRCVYLTNAAVLAGFTLTNGATQTSGDVYTNDSGGGVWCESASVLVTNCVLIGNSASEVGGGAFYGTLNNCTLTGNLATWGGGAYSNTLNNCTLTRNSASDSGGAAFYAMLNNCTLTSNSAYNSGGGADAGALNNCTLTDNSAGSGGGAYYVTLNNCTLVGNLATWGGGAYSSTLSNCTLTGNSATWGGGGAYFGALNNCTLASNSTSGSGGGASEGTLKNCTLTGNLASGDGGGAYSGTLNNCTLAGNSASDGGGAYSATLNNCSLTGNLARYAGGGAYDGSLQNCTVTVNSASTNGGGAYAARLNNCIVYYNTAPSGGNYSSGTLNYCCATPLPSNGVGNTDADPQLASPSHLSATSPCRGAGSALYASGTDIDGESWANSPSIGCDEYWSGAVTGALNVAILAAYTNVATGFAVNLQALVAGRLSGSRWDFGDGLVATNMPFASHTWLAAGDYNVELRAYNETYPSGIAARVTVQVLAQPVHYVALATTNPVPPFNSWATAATNIQNAVDAAALPGALVWVSNGVYQSGARAVYGMSNRVAVTKPVTVRSVNGPAVTTIVGSGPNGSNAVRCVYLTNGAVLAGFTLTNGATQTSGYPSTNRSGGGVWCESASALVANCVLTSNSASYLGGGAAYGTLNSCTLTGNSAYYGGGVSYCALSNCTLAGNSAYDSGGGASYGTLNNCSLTGNSAYRGGGSSFATLNNCTLMRNSARYGGGASYGTFKNCSLTGNSATNEGGGAYRGTINNCIVYYNNASSNANYYSNTLNYCCTTPLPPGPGNFTNAPLFVNTNGWDNLRLESGSPCINAGTNAYAAGSTDLDGRPRIVGGTVDIGAYEFQGPGMSEFIGWLQQYGLATDGSADSTDFDRDGLNNRQEWLAGTNPTNASSVLKLLTPTSGGSDINVSWPSVVGVSYFLERSTNLGASLAFSLLATNLPGQAGTTTFVDTNAAGLQPLFYRVGIGN